MSERQTRNIKQEMVLQRDFYLREDVVQIAIDLLGKYLITEIDGERTVGKIVETEAYRAPEDKASHAYNYRRTPRNEHMYAEGGTAYVYICYGIHHLFNVVTNVRDVPHAVLIRAVEPVENVEGMLLRRNMTVLQPKITAGPGASGVAMGIQVGHSGVDLTDSKSPIWLEDRNLKLEVNEIIASPRVGLTTAEEWTPIPWRFRVKNSIFTSRPK